jgi:hypothetical protein
VEQSIGRIQRQKASERQYRPLVVDVWDRFSRFQTQGLTRIKHYKAQGYDIVYEGQTYGNEPMESSNTHTNKSISASQKTVLYRDED